MIEKNIKEREKTAYLFIFWSIILFYGFITLTDRKCFGIISNIFTNVIDDNIFGVIGVREIGILNREKNNPHPHPPPKRKNTPRWCGSWFKRSLCLQKIWSSNPGRDIPKSLKTGNNSSTGKTLGNRWECHGSSEMIILTYFPWHTRCGKEKNSNCAIVISAMHRWTFAVLY